MLLTLKVAWAQQTQATQCQGLVSWLTQEFMIALQCEQEIDCLRNKGARYLGASIYTCKELARPTRRKNNNTTRPRKEF